MELAIATFDDVIPVEIDAHIYIDYKAGWCKLQDDLPRFFEERRT